MILSKLLREIFQRPKARQSQVDDGSAASATCVTEPFFDWNHLSQTNIRLVCATRESKDSFFSTTALGKSWSLYSSLPVELRLFQSNTTGLPKLYNQAIDESKDSPAILIFIHDDVYLSDFYWGNRIAEGLQQFDVIGLAGNKRRVPRQPAWAFIDEKFTWDSVDNLSGIVGHGSGFPSCTVNVFGPPMAEVKLLDGLFLAAHSQTLIDNKIYFDERFDFDFYDLDFCRQAEAKGLTMGTYPISVIHESKGAFGKPAWREAYGRYLDKWKS